ncbi:MAG: radical SAM protein [Clostridia bacterium]|nr:radical SAM protein [Clostridia bacterium]
MDCKALAQLKAGLLCYGVHVDEEVGKELVKSRPYFYDKGFVHAINTRIYNSNICVSVAENFSSVSPYHMREKNGAFYIEDEHSGLQTPIFLFDDLPKTGTVIDELARPHSNEVISLWPSLVCCYDKPGLKCKFCSIQPTDTQTVVPAQEVVAGLKALFEKTARYSINLGGGTHVNPDKMVDYLCEIVKGTRSFTNNGISLELAPPSDIKMLKKLKDAGASSLIMNLEVANPTLRQEICPGKSRISYEHYYASYRYAVEIFGRGKVSCVLIAGIQPDEDIIAECEKLTDIGVIPTIIPFKPMDDCEYRALPNCSSSSLLYISARVGKMLREKGLSPEMQEGCTKCGGCSLETNYFALE